MKQQSKSYHNIEPLGASALLSCTETWTGTGSGTENDNSPILKVDLGVGTFSSTQTRTFRDGKRQLFEASVIHKCSIQQA